MEVSSCEVPFGSADAVHLQNVGTRVLPRKYMTTAALSLRGLPGHRYFTRRRARRGGRPEQRRRRRRFPCTTGIIEGMCTRRPQRRGVHANRAIRVGLVSDRSHSGGQGRRGRLLFAGLVLSHFCTRIAAKVKRVRSFQRGRRVMRTYGSFLLFCLPLAEVDWAPPL